MFVEMIVSTLISGSVSWAFGDPTLVYLREQVTEAQSASHLKMTLSQEAIYLKNLRTCEYELKMEVPPAHCFSVLEMRRKTRGDNLSSVNLKLRNMEHLCQKYAQKQNNLRLLKFKVEVDGVTTFCKRALSMRIADLEYQRIDEKPEIEQVVQDLGPVRQLVR